MHNGDMCDGVFPNTNKEAIYQSIGRCTKKVAGEARAPSTFWEPCFL